MPGTHLTACERGQIEVLHAQGCSLRAIVNQLGGCLRLSAGSCAATARASSTKAGLPTPISSSAANHAARAAQRERYEGAA